MGIGIGIGIGIVTLLTDFGEGSDYVAAMKGVIAAGVPPGEVGRRIDRWVSLSFGRGRRKDGYLVGEVIHSSTSMASAT